MLRIYFWIYNRTGVTGAGRLADVIARGGPVIIAANHESYLDPPLIGAFFPGRLRFIAWDHLFDSRILAALITPLGAVPVSQEDRSSAAALLRRVMGFIEDGSSVLIFPEGSRSTDGRLQPLEGGVALMSCKTGAPVVPAWIEGTFESFPPHRNWPKPCKITVDFGEPICPRGAEEGLSEKERRAAMLDDIQKAFEAMRDARAARP